MLYDSYQFKIDKNLNVEFVNIVDRSTIEYLIANNSLKIDISVNSMNSDGSVINIKMSTSMNGIIDKIKIIENNTTKKEEIPNVSSFEMNCDVAFEKEYIIEIETKGKKINRTLEINKEDVERTYLGSEGDTVTLPDGYCLVAYGVDTRWYFKWLSGTIRILKYPTFDDQDPAPMTRKSAYITAKLNINISNK